MGGEGVTFATSHPELRDGDPQLQPWCCWQLWKGIFSHCSPLWQQSEVHCCSQSQWITQHKPSHISHTLNRDIHSIFNYDNISSVLLIMNSTGWGPVLCILYRQYFFREFPRITLLESGHLCQGNTTLCFPATVLAVTDRRLFWACLCPDIPFLRPACKTLSKDMNSVIVRW